MSHCHSNGNCAPVKSSNQENFEKHEQKFRGVWYPAEIFDLLARSKITSTEFILLGIIDSLVDAKGEGCWASASYLAKQVGITEGQVRRMLAKLTKLGLIKRVGWKMMGHLKYRVLETAWSRICTHEQTPSADARGTPSADARGIDTQNTSYSSYQKERDTTRAAARLRGVSEFPINGNGHFPASNGNGHSLDKTDRLARIVHDHLNVRHRWSKTKWAAQMNLLVREYGDERVESVLAWYENHAKSRQACENLKIPIVLHARHFRNAFDWIERVMKGDSAKYKNRLRDEEIG